MAGLKDYLPKLVKDKRTLIKDCKNDIDNEVSIRTWLYKVRDLGKIMFLVVRDRSGFLQVVIEDPKIMDKIREIQIGSVLYIRGTIKKTKATKQGIEMINPVIEIVVPVKYPPPIQYDRDTMDINIDTLLEYRPVSIRNARVQFIFNVQSTILQAFREYMINHDFTEFRSPVLMGVPSESGADVFHVKFFDKGDIYLAQSPQLYKQIMLAAFERVFTVTSVFRAEKHNTTRHLLEITQMDAELAFIDSYTEAIQVIEDVVKYMMQKVKDKHETQFKEYGYALPLVAEKIPVFKVKEVLRIVEEKTGKSAVREKLDLDPEDERIIAEYAKEKYSSDFVFVINYHNNKNFYTWDNPEDSDESLSYDLLFRGLEILSGTHRIHIYDELLKRLKENNLHEENFYHYLQAFKYGMPPEAGFSFGLERITKQLFGLTNVREATLFPTDTTRVAAQHLKRFENQRDNKEESNKE